MRVYLFRGLAGSVFSTGMDNLAEKLREDGHEATVHSWVERTGIQAEAISQFNAGELTAPIATVGHSLGGNSANFMGNNLVSQGVPVSYIATIDPTEPRANPAGVPADNFRSRDFRAEKVDGANDISRPELNHIQIDKDKRVHQRIRQMCKAANVGQAVVTPVVASDENDPAEQLTAAIAKLLDKSEGLINEESENQASIQSIVDVLRQHLEEQLEAAGNQNGDSNAVTVDMPVNNALGKKIGKLLNGKKTASGLLGLVATMVLPVLFPQFAPIKAIFENIGIGVSGTTAPGTSLFVPIFSALTGWGVLGKLEKWVNLLRS